MRLRRKSRKNTEVEEIDITSLLDILVILLVFLLKSFNDSDLSVDLANELALPYSIMRGNAADGVTLQVNKKKNVFLNGKAIGNLDSARTTEQLEMSLTNEGKKLEVKKLKTPFLINLVFDKGLKYDSISRIMELSAENGFGKYKLIIQGED